MRLRVVLALALLPFTLEVTAANAAGAEPPPTKSLWQVCESGAPPDEQLAACNALVQSGGKRDLAVAYLNRGVAHIFFFNY